MNIRLLLLSLSIFISLFGLSLMGDFAIDLQAEGLQGRRLKEFDSVAEAIRLDVKRQLDEFMQAENQRDYTDYQYVRIPTFANDFIPIDLQQMAAERSPLGDELSHGLAYGYFSMDPNGAITTPFYLSELPEDEEDESWRYVNNLKQNLQPMLLTAWARTSLDLDDSRLILDENAGAGELAAASIEEDTAAADAAKTDQNTETKSKLTESGRGRNLPITSLEQKEQKAQIQSRSRDNVIANAASNQQMTQSQVQNRIQQLQMAIPDRTMLGQQIQHIQAARRAGELPPAMTDQAQNAPMTSGEQIQIRIDPLRPFLVPGLDSENHPFDAQVFMLRQVQIEEHRFLQGFRLNTDKLQELIDASAQQATSIYQGMSYELARLADRQAAYAAILDFGFGALAVNLWELDPQWITKEISRLRYWYFGIVAVVFLVVALGVAGLWRSASAQLKLARQKDDFISAVSHELRTPLTSIRMYTEMLEKDWIKSDDKRRDYYRSMRAESERLSRLIENVLDFSRIQRQSKRYDFKLGDLNQCIRSVVDMMQPYAAKNDFTINTRFAPLPQLLFDHDAVMQIVINLIDNAVKYARHADDKTITVSTRPEGEYILIDIEDRGPGLPHQQHKKVFEEFYRLEAEDTRETAGAGLGLALVQKFAEAHRGFVKILDASPTGCIFRVALAAQN